MPEPDQIRACIDRSLPPDLAASALRAVRPPSLAALIEKLWPNGSVLWCSFTGGDPEVHAKVAAYARQWEQHANIRFDFRPSYGGEIRIAFQPGGSWSYLGTDALQIPRNQPTMNFGWLTPQTVDAEYSRVVIHEFGHALGAVHEHQHPEAGIPWDREAVYRYYGGPPNNWTREDIEHNLFAKYDRTITRFSAFDPTSVMCYPVPNELTVGDYEVGWNTVLSETDKQFAGILYPRQPPPPPPPTDPWNTDFQGHFVTGWEEGGVVGSPKIGYVRGFTARLKQDGRWQE